LVLAPASPARAAIVTLDFTGTYDTGDDTVFGLSGPALPFFFSLTYDTSLDTNTAFGAAGIMPDGTVPLLDNVYGYSRSGIIDSTLVFGSGSWIFMVTGRGEVALGGIVRGAEGISYSPDSYVKDGYQWDGTGP
jgi:hypothetical protein